MLSRPPIIATLLDILPDAVVMVDAQARIAFASQAVEPLLGYEPGELIGQPLEILVPESARDRHAAMVEQYRREGEARHMGSRPLLHARRKSGEQIVVSISLANIVLDGEPLSVAVIRDATLIDYQLSRATRMAQSDPLTGLANRLHLSRRMEALMEQDAPFALLYIDLTRFKQINDRHGHAAGDQGLRVVAQRLAAHLREGDLAVRMGGDEFVLLFEWMSAPAALVRRAEDVIRHLAEPAVVGDGLQIRLGAAIGGAIHPRDGATAAALLEAADRRMYAAKRAGGGCRIDDQPTADAPRVGR